MPVQHSLILSLLGLTALSTLSAQTCEVSFGFSQSYATIFFEADYLVPEGHTIAATNWNFGDGATGSQLQPIHTYPFYGTFHCCVTLSTMDAKGSVCEFEQCATIEVLQPQPCAVEANFEFTLGQDGLVDFTPEVTADAGTVINAVTWDLGDGTTSNTLNSWTHTYSEAGTMDVCLIVEALNTTEACSSTVCKSIEIAPFHCLVKAGMSTVVDACSVAATLETYVEGQTQVEAVMWTVDGAWASEDQVLELLLEPGQGANICVQVEATSPGSVCDALECIWVDSPCGSASSISIQDTSVQFALYPNPAVNWVRIDGFTEGIVRIYALNGAMVLEAQSALVDCSSLCRGIYVVEVQSGGTTSRQQLAIQ